MLTIHWLRSTTNGEQTCKVLARSTGSASARYANNRRHSRDWQSTSCRTSAGEASQPRSFAQRQVRGVDWTMSSSTSCKHKPPISRCLLGVEPYSHIAHLDDMLANQRIAIHPKGVLELIVVPTRLVCPHGLVGWRICTFTQPDMVLLSRDLLGTRWAEDMKWEQGWQHAQQVSRATYHPSIKPGLEHHALHLGEIHGVLNKKPSSLLTR